MKKLSNLEIRKSLRMVPEWSRKGSAIRREYSFTDFLVAMRFVNRVARRAEKLQHHPDIDIRWNRVVLALTTHDASGLTARDFALAEHCDALAGRP